MLYDIKYNTEVLQKWFSTIKSPCLEAKSSDYQSAMFHSTSLFSTRQCVIPCSDVAHKCYTTYSVKDESQ